MPSDGINLSWMGCICSTPSVVTYDILDMPAYFDNRPVTIKDVLIAKNSWNILESNLCPLFFEQQLSMTEDQCPFSKAILWFYSVFHNRLLVSCPVSGIKTFNVIVCDLFQHLQNLTTKLVDAEDVEELLNRMFQVLFIPITRESHFRDRATLFAEQTKFLAVEYGAIGNVMFWSLKACLAELLSKDAKEAWVRVYCRLLKVVVPLSSRFQVSQQYELESLNPANSSLKPVPTHDIAYFLSGAFISPPTIENRDPEEHVSGHFRSVDSPKLTLTSGNNGNVGGAEAPTARDSLFVRVSKRLITRVTPLNDDLVEEEIRSISIESGNRSIQSVKSRSNASDKSRSKSNLYSEK